MDAIGCHEMLMPVIQPAELWQKTGRYEIDELFKLRDRKDAEMVLAMTHEEALTSHVARDVRSYRELPLMLYHLQTKERDEPRPRAGILRTREFTMKDAYSFDRDEEGLRSQLRAAGRRLRADPRSLRPALVRGRVRRRDDGRLRRARVHGALRGRRERGRARARLRGQHRGRERRRPSRSSCRRRSTRRARRRLPGLTTVDEVAAALGVPTGALIKAMPIVAEDRGLVLVLVRGDHRLNEIKLANHLGAAGRPARQEEIEEAIGPVGFIGPVGPTSPS